MGSRRGSRCDGRASRERRRSAHATPFAGGRGCRDAASAQRRRPSRSISVCSASSFGALEVVEQAAALADHHQQAAARVVVLLVRLEVLGQVGDALGQDRDLHLRRTGVALLVAYSPMSACLRSAVIDIRASGPRRQIEDTHRRSSRCLRSAPSAIRLACRASSARTLVAAIAASARRRVPRGEHRLAGRAAGAPAVPSRPTPGCRPARSRPAPRCRGSGRTMPRSAVPVFPARSHRLRRNGPTSVPPQRDDVAERAERQRQIADPGPGRKCLCRNRISKLRHGPHRAARSARSAVDPHLARGSSSTASPRGPGHRPARPATLIAE